MELLRKTTGFAPLPKLLQLVSSAQVSASFSESKHLEQTSVLDRIEQQVSPITSKKSVKSC